MASALREGPIVSVADYLERGWHPIPIHGIADDCRNPGKQPVGEKWQTQPKPRNGQVDRLFAGRNVGLLLGEPSGNLFDVDLDAPEARDLAPAFLPGTGLTHGRASSPSSHWWYRCDKAPQTTRWNLTEIDPKTNRPRNGETLVELRGTGGQTVVPPSTHPSGEVLTWESDGDPAEVAYDELRDAVNRLAMAAWLVRRGWGRAAATEWAHAPVANPTLPVRLLEWAGLVEPKATIPADPTGFSERVWAAGDVGRVLAELGFHVDGQRGRCPLRDHEHARDSFVWGDSEPHMWFCHACEQGGTTIHLVEQLRGGSYVEARRWLAERLGVELPGERAERFELPADRNGTAAPLAEPDPWPNPVPICGPPPPAFPVHALPQWLGDWVRGQSGETQTPPSLAAFAALGVLSIALARKIEVRPHGTQYVAPVHCYFCTVLGPANRKSSVYSAAGKPVRDEERRLADEGRGQRHMRTQRRKRLEQRIKQLEAKASKAETEADALADMQEAARLMCELDETPPVADPQLLVDDTTPEALVGQLALNNERMGILAAEGTILAIMGGRYSKNGGAQLEVFLKGHDGEPIAVNRMSRSERVDKPALTLCLAVQDDVIRSASKDSAFRGRGLLGRFWWAVPQSLVGQRDPHGVPMQRWVSETYAANMTALLRLPLPAEPVVVSFSREARARLEAFSVRVEAMLADGGELELLRDWGGKLVGHTARLATLLAAAEALGVPVEVTEADVEAAVAVAEWAVPHAQLAFGVSRLDNVAANAIGVLDWIRRTGTEAFSRRDVHRALHRRFSRAEEAAAALELLAENGWLRGEGEQDRRRPYVRPRYRAHPSLLQ